MLGGVNVDVLSLYQETGAYLEGHFKLASGRHAARFLQSTTVLQYPEHADTLGQALAHQLREKITSEVNFVLGPAMGGVVLAYVVARALGCRALFAEKNARGEMIIREAFRITPGEMFIAVEDVITTGGSLMRAVHAAEAHGARCAGLGCIIDRGQARLPETLPYTSLAQLSLESYPSETCPLCRQDIPLEDV